MKTNAPYGSWISPLELRALFERPSPPMYPTSHNGLMYWLEAKPDQGGRIVLIRREQDGSETCITPEGFNIRTRVHEYGGQCFVITDGSIVFSNFADNRLYRQRLTPADKPVALTPASNSDGSIGLYADLQVVKDEKWLVFVFEKAFEDEENVNCIAAINLAHDAGVDQEPQILVAGHDFFVNLVISTDNKRLAWVQWDHPNMPWDCSEVGCAELTIDNDVITVSKNKTIAGGDGHSVCQLSFSPNGVLYFAMDKEAAANEADNFWNLYRFDPGSPDEGISQVTTDTAE